MTRAARSDSPRRGKAYEAVIQHVESAILDGEQPIGSALPPERELAAQLGVSRAAVREGIRALEAQGVLTSTTGVGPSGGTRVTAERSKALTRLLRLQVAMAHFPVAEVVELRVALERTTAALAADHATSTDLRRMRSALEAMAAPTTGLDAFNELDTQFHVAVAQAGGMQLVSDLTIAVRESLRLPILEAERALDDWPAFRTDLHADHTAVFGAIHDGDGARAAAVMEKHIRMAYTILMPDV